jgi:transposase-like protein
VRRLVAGEHALSQLARDLGGHPNLLGAWRRKYGTISTPKIATKTPLSLEDEIARLRRENAALREAGEILKAGASSSLSPATTAANDLKGPALAR